jgi:hypothetical protein
MLAAHQPQFAPWLGFFDKLDRADVFVLLDNVQFKKNEWQNRNRIKSANGEQWLTVPVSFHFGDKISEVTICRRHNWEKQHLQALRSCYGRAPYFEETLALYEEVIHQAAEKMSDLNVGLLRALTKKLGITTRTLLASELEPLTADRDERLVELCGRLGAETYLAGEGGRGYMNLDRFYSKEIEVVFQSYQHPSYPQLFGDFSPRLSVLDLLFNCGPESMDIVRQGRNEDREDA